MISLTDVAEFFGYKYIKLRTIPYFGRVYIGYKTRDAPGYNGRGEVICRKQEIDEVKQRIAEERLNNLRR